MVQYKANYSINNNLQLTNVFEAKGATLVKVQGVGRKVYVQSLNGSAKQVNVCEVL